MTTAIDTQGDQPTERDLHYAGEFDENGHERDTPSRHLGDHERSEESEGIFAAFMAVLPGRCAVAA